MKQKKNNLLSLIALILALAALAVSALGYANQSEDQTHLIDDLYKENRQLAQRVEELEGQLEQLLTVTNLASWTLDVKPWADSTGADVLFTAVPSGYQSGISAAFLVELEGQLVAEVPCQWDGSVFTATVSLDAVDGYSYFCRLTAPGGTQQLALATPISPNGEEAVFLQSGLESYGNLVINDWVKDGDEILLTDAYAQVQLPRIGSDGLQITNAELVVQYDGEEFTAIPITMTPSEVAGSFDVIITDLSIPLPQMEEGKYMDLYLEVSLSDGRNLWTFGITWSLDDGQLSASVG